MTITAIAFQTKARTVDHLGREQIADSPTAVAELWKNAYDAYAREVRLDIFGGEAPAAAILDDGHGMSLAEFVDRWLVVGTESKASGSVTPIEDRNGLYLRPKQGQKGIGRLSCANLGPVLLLISKRSKRDFVAALVDWRLFSNPFLNLSDIEIPVGEFKDLPAIFAQLPEMQRQLRTNVVDTADEKRGARLKAAWDTYDALVEQEQGDRWGARSVAPSRAILKAANEPRFRIEQLERWGVVAKGDAHGTALLISDISYDLRMQLRSDAGDSTAVEARLRFRQTLSSFVDPYVDAAHPEKNARDSQFAYSVAVWPDGRENTLLGSATTLSRKSVEPMEHQLEGTIDEKGTFTGRVKAFGKWLLQDIQIPKPDDLTMGEDDDASYVGPVDLYIASMEFAAANTSHTEPEFERFKAMAEEAAAFLIFRDGLRVLPYGRPDNDFFEIESRRTRNAGREFWNHRQMFGRIAIARESNPNLRDKAGREGLIDNRAAKTLKQLIDNILKQSARLYFGSSSEVRSEALKNIQENTSDAKAQKERLKLQKKQRREFRVLLDKQALECRTVLKEARSYPPIGTFTDERQIEAAQAALDGFDERLGETGLPAIPQPLGTLEKAYDAYRRDRRELHDILAERRNELEAALSKFELAQPRRLLEAYIDRADQRIRRRIAGWQTQITDLQRQEFERIRELSSERTSVFGEEAKSVILRFEREELSLSEAQTLISKQRETVDEENEDLFAPYVAALQSLQESIDLQRLAYSGMHEVGSLRTELDRLNGLAQLGIAVEIVGHELEALDNIIGSGLRRLPDEVRNSAAVRDIEFGYEGLTDQLRFLSPLKLTGNKSQEWVTGEEIGEYLKEFFKLTLARQEIDLEVDASFAAFRIFEFRSRLYPVFVNLVNNSIYWVRFKEEERRVILLSARDNEVIVSDNGPGVAPTDVGNLFTLFFTRKTRGGRGVGLYLCRANLAAGGHRISYGAADQDLPLGGANFIIEFRGIADDAA